MLLDSVGETGNKCLSVPEGNGSESAGVISTTGPIDSEMK